MTTGTPLRPDEPAEIDAEARGRPGSAPTLTAYLARVAAARVPSSRCPAASTRAWSPPSAWPPSARNGSSACTCRSGSRRPTPSMLSRLVSRLPGHRLRAARSISPILEAAGCYRRRDDAIRMVCPEYGPGYRSKIVLPSVIDSDSFRLYSVVVLAPDGTADQAPAHPRVLPRDRRRDELQAAGPQDARVLPRGPAQLRRHRDAEPARVRPGLLREARRRLRGRQADRPPLQDRRCTRSRSTSASRRRSARGPPPPTPTRCRSRRRSSTSRCRTTGWTCACTARTTACPSRRSRTPPTSPSSRSSASTATSTRSGRRRSTCTCPRASWSRSRRSARLVRLREQPAAPRSGGARPQSAAATARPAVRPENRQPPRKVPSSAL